MYPPLAVNDGSLSWSLLTAEILKCKSSQVCIILGSSAMAAKETATSLKVVLTGVYVLSPFAFVM